MSVEALRGASRPMFIRETLGLLATQARYALLVSRDPAAFVYEGVTLPLRATPQLRRIRRSCYRGTYERYEMEAIRRLLRPEDVVLELGAGCGVITTFIAQRLSDSRNLHSYEANPDLLSSIARVTEANGVSPTLVNAAVGAQDGRVDFHIEADFLSSSIHERGRVGRIVSVPVFGLAGLLGSIQPSVLVFDIEGAESELLDVPLPPSLRVICGEVHPHIIGDRAVTQFVRHIIDAGFDLLTDLSQGRAVAFARP